MTSLFICIYMPSAFIVSMHVCGFVWVCELAQNTLATLPKENKYPYKSYVPGISKKKRRINEEKKIHYSYLTFNLYMLIEGILARSLA